jgi:hypothetical protein
MADIEKEYFTLRTALSISEDPSMGTQPAVAAGGSHANSYPATTTTDGSLSQSLHTVKKSRTDEMSLDDTNSYPIALASYPDAAPHFSAMDWSHVVNPVERDRLSALHDPSMAGYGGYGSAVYGVNYGHGHLHEQMLQHYGGNCQSVYNIPEFPELDDFCVDTGAPDLNVDSDVPPMIQVYAKGGDVQDYASANSLDEDDCDDLFLSGPVTAWDDSMIDIAPRQSKKRSSRNSPR